MAVKEASVLHARFGATPIADVKLKIDDDTIDAGKRATLSVMIKNVSPGPMAGVKLTPKFNAGGTSMTCSPPDVTIDLDPGEEETHNFILENTAASQANVEIGVNVTGLTGIPSIDQERYLEVP